MDIKAHDQIKRLQAQLAKFAPPLSYLDIAASCENQAFAFNLATLMPKSFAKYRAQRLRWPDRQLQIVIGALELAMEEGKQDDLLGQAHQFYSRGMEAAGLRGLARQEWQGRLGRDLGVVLERKKGKGKLVGE